MATYQVSFFKHLLSSDGRPFKVLQKAIEVHSADCDEAVETAKKDFARIRGITDWSTHADVFEVAPIEGESDPWVD